MRALVGREAGDSDAGNVEAAPVSEPDDDHVADGRRDEAGKEHGQHRGAQAGCCALHHQHACDDRAAEHRCHGREGSGGREDGTLALVEPRERREDNGNNRTERDERRLGTEHGAERERGGGRESDSEP